MPAPISTNSATPPLAAGSSPGLQPADPLPATPNGPPPTKAPPTDGVATPFDVTAESVPDSAAALSQAAIRRAELFMLAQHVHDQEQQLRLDRMRSEFDNTQARRAELLREANALRDMALEQMKHDDEVLKKFISWI